MDVKIIVATMAAAVQAGTPILYATIGEIITEKSGVLNLGVEGIMLIGAFCGFFVTKITGDPYLGVLGAGIGGTLFSLIHAICVLIFQANQIVSGLALTILGTGLSYFWGTPFVGQKTIGFEKLNIMGISNIPVVGEIFFRHDLLVYLSYILPMLVWYFLEKTRWGLEIRAAGEDPEAARSSGLNVTTLRALGISIGGFLCGIGGGYLSLAYTHIWTNGLVAGRGWIAVALVIFSFWSPLRAVIGSYLFGGIMAFQLRLQATGTTIPSSILLMLPYILTIVVLTIASKVHKGSWGPMGLGINLEPKE